ncbi:bifunctional (p)ppGpp synthetase/guanosine-3',5'-bis(diphosphate) 3'-pyrophosphohydrolase [Lysobacter pythonis]|uniref:guanosine-3',5'-bis(diphosphate) 3'-diphosphatase n=1 Tax=Solilutibacter pythonis TaxID=2483112 RepID=A0A3M2HW86_9GAMM|nr:bifunctional (p)ppGpp synthetase/guanosine-3',5'-bis(diphosphate) 3'-pyrophosphohydrolase [Lysobacter pythonis]RMH93298.1 bifunctional (p)ppGpp synthetase/guanosine-3',5'-bis(diphosphate) 3'-pyrophosphohydrolase [Lysobacter pythonis]
MKSPVSGPPAPASATSEGALPPGYVQSLLAAAHYLPEDERRQLVRAWEVGAAAHVGQTRKSGEPYITHPVAVAEVLAEQRMDFKALAAAILHDTIEDTPLKRDAIAAEFGETVAELVEGVTKLDKLKFRDRQEAAAESFRKMMLAMSRDLRVILIKLADRLHNMRTLGAQGGEARRRIARETLDIYAPIAQRLGMNLVKGELQDLSFKALYPWRYAALAKRIREQPVVRREAMIQIEAQLAQKLAKEGLRHRLVGRVKSPWSIYRKMRDEQKSLEQVLDVFGFRVIVGSVADCYHALGVVHSVFKPLDGRFRDFIAIPKANGYQSLHTVLFGPYGAPVEVQIRTEEMDLLAERGIAAHWTYKQGGEATSPLTRASSWLTELMESQKATGSSLEFLENVKVDLYPDEVYVFTPKGRILSLPRNSTALDFAYAVHTDVGNHAVTARVDGRLMPLRSKLASGQTIEIVIARTSTPKPQWLEFVASGKARTAIRQQLKQIEHEDAVHLGHRMLEAALESHDSGLERLPKGRLDKYLGEQRYPRLEALLADIALGNRMPMLVAQWLVAGEDDGQPATRGQPHEALAALGRDRILITGAERGVISFAQCCQPIPGDDIMGFHAAGKGVVVHRMACPNLAEYRRAPERWVEIGWDRQVSGDYASSLRVDVDNRPGVLAQVAAAIAQAESNIDSVDYLERDGSVSLIRFGIEVHDVRHLEEVIRRVRRLQVVHEVARL